MHIGARAYVHMQRVASERGQPSAALLSRPAEPKSRYTRWIAITYPIRPIVQIIEQCCQTRPEWGSARARLGLGLPWAFRAFNRNTNAAHGQCAVGRIIFIFIDFNLSTVPQSCCHTSTYKHSKSLCLLLNFKKIKIKN